MVLKTLKAIFKTKHDIELNEALVPSFKTLMQLKKDVPYLKDFHLKKTSYQAGDAQSAFKGRGIEFEEVRLYQFGDDVRDIDWRVTARKNQPFTKLYMEEKDREVYVWLDLSSKMYFGTTGELKSVTAAKVSALIGWFALSYKDRFGLALYTGRQTYLFEPRRNQEYFLSILKKIENASEENLHNQTETETSQKSLQYLQKKAGRHTIVFLVGSFDLNNQNIVKEITSLMQRNEVYLVDIYDKLEEICPPKGEYVAEFGGDKEIIRNSGEKYEVAYDTYFENKRRAVKDFCLKNGAHYRAIRSDLPIYKQLRPI